MPGSSLAGGKIAPPLMEDLHPSPEVAALDLRQEIIRQLVHPRGAALTMGPFDSPSHGSTLCLGSLPLPLEYGDFKVYAFETTAFGRHVLAVTKGDISSPEPLLIRMHSECVTSETLRGCDCDCVEQLNAALKNIADEERGVLFYLRQEGRGAGYACKSRDRMAVASSEDSLGTFDVYEALGLKADPRSYEFMSDLVNLLGISAPLRVMTNNPLKLEGIESATGLPIEERCQLSVPANPFNLYYLQSKSKGGHMLDYNSQQSESAYPWPVETFKPYVLKTPGAMRFVHMASYPLPVRPTEGVMVLDTKQLNALTSLLGSSEGMHIEPFDGQRKFKVELSADLLASARADGRSAALVNFIATHPYWFNDHVYHDRISHLDYVALTYDANPSATPLVRVQSENLFSRFPLRAEDRSTKYQNAVQEIIENGRGMLLLYPEDGKGKGFSALFLEKFLMHHQQSRNHNEAIGNLGIQNDRRDFQSIAALIGHHYPNEGVKLLLGSAESGSVEALKSYGIAVDGAVLVK